MPHTFTVPASAALPSSAGPDATSELLGEDILFDEDFQMNGAGDWVVLEDEDVVWQGILHRLATRPGEYKLRPEYGVGCDEFVKGKITKTNMSELARRIKDNLAQDRRISRVVEVVVQRAVVDGATGVRVYLKAEMAGRVQTFRPFTFVGSVGGVVSGA